MSDESTTAEERAAWIPRQVPFAEEDNWVRRLIADVERRTNERRMAEEAIRKLDKIRASLKAQLEDAVERLRQTRDWSVAIRALDSWHEINLQNSRCDCPGHKRIETLRVNLKKMEDTFLAGYPDPRYEQEISFFRPERSIGGGNGGL